jgi:hypothetical protein
VSTTQSASRPSVFNKGLPFLDLTSSMADATNKARNGGARCDSARRLDAGHRPAQLTSIRAAASLASMVSPASMVSERLGTRARQADRRARKR